MEVEPTDLSGDPAHDTAAGGEPAFYLGDKDGNPVHADAAGNFPEGSKMFPFYDVKVTDLSEDEVLSALAERVRHTIEGP